MEGKTQPEMENLPAFSPFAVIFSKVFLCTSGKKSELIIHLDDTSLVNLSDT